MGNKVEKRIFLGMEVRVVNNEYIVLKDMFNALGRVKIDGTWTNEKNKLLTFLADLNKTTDHQLLVVSSKGKKQSRETQEFDCLKLETVPIVLTQFRPTKSNRRTESENEMALETWRNFMKFVDTLLIDLEVYKYIITDKEKQKEHMDILVEEGGSPMISNKQVNTVMAKLIGVYDQGIKSIKKEELKQYENQTTVDLLEVRDFVLDNFINAYRFTESHKSAGEMVLNLAKKKYNI